MQLLQEVEEKKDSMKLTDKMPKLVLKRYLLERGYEIGNYIRLLENKQVISEIKYQNLMYKQLLKGKLEIDEIRFQEWYRRLCQDRRLLISYLYSLGYLHPSEDVYELVEAAELPSNIIGRYDFNTQKIISMAGKSLKINREVEPIRGCLLANGMYTKERSYINSVLTNHGSFLMGYCGDVASEYTKRVIDHYHKLKTSLLKRGVSNIEGIDAQVGFKKVYVLNYNVTPVPPIIEDNQNFQEYSQR